MTRYLALPNLLRIAERAIDGEVLVRDYGLLESALARPRASVFGQDAYPTIHAKGAALLHALCSNHALVDGNKRLALLATLTFLRINGVEPGLSEEEAVDLTMAVADGSLVDVEKIAERLR